jgi:hypothetical protein
MFPNNANQMGPQDDPVAKLPPLEASFNAALAEKEAFAAK